MSPPLVLTSVNHLGVLWYLTLGVQQIRTVTSDVFVISTCMMAFNLFM